MAGSPGLKSSLIDNEGFPRDDVDLMEVRKLRNKHAILQTDHKNIMKLIENRLFGLHVDYKEIHPIGKEPEPVVKESAPLEVRKESQIDSSNSKETNGSEKIPFVWIHDVAPGSPAEQDGFQIGDALYRFGEVTCKDNEEALNKVVDTVK